MNIRTIISYLLKKVFKDEAPRSPSVLDKFMPGDWVGAVVLWDGRMTILRDEKEALDYYKYGDCFEELVVPDGKEEDYEEIKDSSVNAALDIYEEGDEETRPG